MRGRTARWGTGLALLCLTLPLAPRDAVAQESASVLEVRLKAAFLYKFAGYVEWPVGTAQEPLRFGIIGDDEVARVLSHLVRDRGAGARPVEVVRMRAFEPLPPLHVLFIGRSESDRLPSLIRTTRGQPVLVVTDTEGALASGSMINFKVVGGHMRFDVGLGSAKRSGLTLSSRLLSVAQVVSTRTP
ncbi:MAG TPA: YfiR family protein [Candidatus Eisenbacteria bacterium]|nr:YfiR family protein [Candidatus Eisenbacteria bacterium]